MEDTGKYQAALPRKDADAKAKQWDMKASSGATQLNNGGDLQDFNHQTVKIGPFFFNNGTSSRLKRISALSFFRKSPTSPKEPSLAGHSRSATPVQGNADTRHLNDIEDKKGPVEPEEPKTAAGEVTRLESELLGTQRGEGNLEAQQSSAEVPNLDKVSPIASSEQVTQVETSKSVPRSEYDHPYNQKQTAEPNRTCLRGWKWSPKSRAALVILLILTGAGIGAGIGIPLSDLESHRDPSSVTTSETAATLQSTTSTALSIPSNSMPPILQQTNNDTQSSTIKAPSSNMASTTSLSSIQTLSTSYTLAAAALTSICPS